MSKKSKQLKNESKPRYSRTTNMLFGHPKKLSVLTELLSRHNQETIKLGIFPDAHRKLMAYFNNCQIEISGVGIARIHPLRSDMILITDVFLLKQSGGELNTVIPACQLSEIVRNLIEKGENPGDLRLWWHSHAKMGPFWSQTDKKTISDLNENWSVAIVGNIIANLKMRVDLYKPFRTSINIPKLEIINDNQETFVENIRTEILSKVIANSPTIIDRELEFPVKDQGYIPRNFRRYPDLIYKNRE